MVARPAPLQGTGAAGRDGDQRAELEQAFIDRVRRNERHRPMQDVQDRDTALAILACEVARSRRYGHRLALVGILPARNGRFASADAAVEIRKRVRIVDDVWVTAEGVFVLLPESGSDEAAALIERMRCGMRATMDEATAHVAVFPTDALTTAALFDVARGRTRAALVEPPACDRPDRQLAAVAPSASPVQSP